MTGGGDLNLTEECDLKPNAFAGMLRDRFHDVLRRLEARFCLTDPTASIDEGLEVTFDEVACLIASEGEFVRWL